MVDRFALRLIAVLLFLTLMMAAMWFGAMGAWVAAARGIAGGVLVVGGYVLVTMPLRTTVPAGIETVGDLARMIAPIEIPSTAVGRRLIVEQRVLEAVRAVVADVTGLSLGDVRAESVLLSDLKMA